MIIVNKINILRGILITLLIIQFGTIFNFSSQDGEKSGSLSREITVTITKDIKSIQSLEKNRKEEVLKKIEHIIRKMAHFSLYTLIGILTASLMSTYKIKQIKRTGISFLIGAFYAISDEMHQSFVPDRTPGIGDVLIDCSGVIFGILIVMLVLNLYRCIQQNWNINKL